MRRSVLLVVTATLGVTACGGDDSTDSVTSAESAGASGDANVVIDPGDDGSYSVDIDPAQFPDRQQTSGGSYEGE